MKNIVLLACPIISLILYFFAPVVYNQTFCTICGLIAFTAMIIVLSDDTKNIGLLNFNFIFSFSFFAGSFVFPIFLVGGKSIIGGILMELIETIDTVNKSSAVCSLAFSCYSLAYCMCRERHSIDFGILANKARGVYKNSRLLVAVVSVVEVVSVILYFGTHEDSINNDTNSYLNLIFTFLVPTLFVTALIYKRNGTLSRRLKGVVLENIVTIVCIISLFVVNTIVGDRNLLFQLLIMGGVMYSMFVKKFRPRSIVLLGAVGIIFMFSLRATRVSSSSSLRSGDVSAYMEVAKLAIREASAWDLLSDLIGASFELNEGMYLAEKYNHPHTAPNIVRYVTAPIPFASTFIITHFFNLEVSDIAPDSMIRDYTNTHPGNHIVIDAYMPFGWVGVIASFLFFGFFVAKITNGLGRNLFCTIFYVYLSSLAVYYPRSHMDAAFKIVLVAYIIYFLFTRMGGWMGGHRTSVSLPSSIRHTT